MVDDCQLRILFLVKNILREWRWNEDIFRWRKTKRIHNQETCSGRIPLENLSEGSASERREVIQEGNLGTSGMKWGNRNDKYWVNVIECSLLQFSSVAKSCPTLCDPKNHSTPGLLVHHHLPEFTQTHVHRVGDAIQSSHPLSSPSPPAPNPSQHQSLFQWVNSSHEVAQVLEFQL